MPVWSPTGGPSCGGVVGVVVHDAPGDIEEVPVLQLGNALVVTGGDGGVPFLSVVFGHDVDDTERG